MIYNQNKYKLLLEKYTMDAMNTMDVMNIYEITKRLNVNDIKQLTDEERTELFKKKNSGDVTVRDTLILSNIKLVSSIVNKYFNRFKNQSDLFFEGCCGLIKAVDSFDVNKGIKFSAYAYPTIKGTILNYINSDGPVSMRRDFRELGNKARNLESKLLAETGKNPTRSQLAEMLSVAEDVLAVAIAATEIPKSLSNWEKTKDNAFDEDDSINPDKIEDRAYSSLVRNIDAYIDLKMKLEQKEKWNPDNRQFDDKTATKKVNESFEGKIESEKKLLNKDPISWILEIEDMDPNRYYNRLIALLHKNSEFAKEAEKDYEHCSGETIGKRNILIRDAIINNMRDTDGNPINSIQLSPEYEYSNIEDALTRSDRLFTVRKPRGVAFLSALAFNLDYSTTEELMVHCLSESKFDFKNPYEVMLAYCLIDERPSCEHYLELKQEYESIDLSKTDYYITDRSTHSYEEKFWEISEDEDLIKFVCCLPKNNSQSARKVFKDNYDKLYAELAKNQEDLYDILNAYLEPDVDVKTKHSLQNEIGISDSDLLNRFFGKSFRKNRRDQFSFLRKKVFNANNLRNIIAGTENVTKEELLLVLFFRYCSSENYANLKTKFNDSESSKLVRKIYYSFKGFANPELETAGFDYVYLPNPFERFLMFCLVCEEPLEAFKAIMMNN